MNVNPHTLNMVGPADSAFPIHHTRGCVDAGRADSCRGCYPSARSHQGIALLARRKSFGLGGGVGIRAIIEVG